MIGGAKIYFKQEHLNHTGSHKPTNTLFQVLLATRMGKKKIICESGAGQHWSAAAATAAKFSMPIFGVMGNIDCKRINQNIIKEFYKRFIIPLYIPLLSLIPFLLIIEISVLSSVIFLFVSVFLLRYFFNTHFFAFLRKNLRR